MIHSFATHQNNVFFLLQTSFSVSCVSLWSENQRTVWKERRSVIGRLKRMCQNPAPHQSPGTI